MKDIGLVTAAGLVLLGVTAWAVADVTREREAIRAFCQPRGYIGGAMVKGVGGTCIAKNGDEVPIYSIKQAEAKK